MEVAVLLVIIIILFVAGDSILNIYIDNTAAVKTVKCINKEFEKTIAFEGEIPLSKNCISLDTFRKFNGEKAAEQYIRTNWDFFTSIIDRSAYKDRIFAQYLLRIQTAKASVNKPFIKRKINAIARHTKTKFNGYHIKIYYEYTSPAGRNHYNNEFVFSWYRIRDFVEKEKRSLGETIRTQYKSKPVLDPQEQLWEEARRKYGTQEPGTDSRFDNQQQNQANTSTNAENVENTANNCTAQKVNQKFPATFCYTPYIFTPEQVLSGKINFEDCTGVYVFINRNTDQCYVGQAKSIIKRLGQHLHGRGGNQDVYADYKYGAKFEIRIYPIYHSQFKTLDEMERYYIGKYDAYKNGYNKTQGNS